MLAAVAVVLAIGVVAYAAIPLIGQLLTSERGASALPMQTIGQSRTADGVVVTINQAYADANRILVAYTIQAPAGFQASPGGLDGNVHLSTAEGSTLPFISAQGVGGDTASTLAGLAGFDADSLPAGVGNVALNLTFPNVHAAAQAPGRARFSAGTFSFSFSLPVAPGAVVTSGLRATHGGVSVTLDRVVVTPSETRAYFSFPATHGIPASDWIADGYLAGTGWNSRQLPASLPSNVDVTLGDYFVNSQGEHVTTWSGDFGGRHGRWTLTVDELTGGETGAPSSSTGSPEQARIAGPWTFTFSVP